MESDFTANRSRDMTCVKMCVKCQYVEFLKSMFTFSVTSGLLGQQSSHTLETNIGMNNNCVTDLSFVVEKYVYIISIIIKANM